MFIPHPADSKVVSTATEKTNGSLAKEVTT